MPSIEQVLNANLEPYQRDAACEPAGEVLCLACAGSGKTRVLAYRIAWLVSQNVDPAHIVAFTFTEKAAESIKRRVAEALTHVGYDPTVIGRMYIGTIHAYCQKVLGEIDATFRQFDVLDENRLKLYIMSRYPALGLAQYRQTRGERYFKAIKHLSEAWKALNDEMLAVEAVAVADASLGGVLGTLQHRLMQDQFIDFSLMIRLVVDALAADRVGASESIAKLRHLLVDEYQDVNPAQETLIRELRRRGNTLFVVGDDDQAIYGWRGADVNNILTFTDRYPNAAVHRLPHNFRSTEAIVAAADQFVTAQLGATRIAKNPTARNRSGPRDLRRLWFANRQEEADWVADRIAGLLGTEYIEADGTIRGLTPGDFAILMRSTRSAERDESPRHAAFTRALAARGIPFTLEAGGGIFERREASVLREAFELLRNGSPDRQQVRTLFDTVVQSAFPLADFTKLTELYAEWGRRIHGPTTEGARRRVFPQQLVYDLLSAFGMAESALPAEVMRDLGLFSRMIQDVETVYLSIDSTARFQDVLNFLGNVAESGYDTSTDDLVRRPDAVMISTVHKAKGLEFPGVFVSDVEAKRFPSSEGRSYQGWLPASVIQPAVMRGAYVSTVEGEARLFYTAVTRAERYLYVTGAQQLPGGRLSRRPSPFALGLNHAELTTDPNGLPAGLASAVPRPRIEESDVPTSFSEIRYYLLCPKNYQFRKGFGFSPPVPEMFGFGRTVHTAVGKLHEVHRDRAPTGDEAQETAEAVFHLKHVAPSRVPETRPGPYERARERASEIVRTYAESFGEDFVRERQVEVSFEIPARGAVISGSIDLLVREDAAGNIVEAQVIDFKAIEGGDDPTTNPDLDWTALALQVQLYAKAAREVLSENARTGAVHLLKDNQRIDVPVDDEAVDAAIQNVEWAIERIVAGDFPMRPYPEKCSKCEFARLCLKHPQEFSGGDIPPPLQVPSEEGELLARAFDQFTEP